MTNEQIKAAETMQADMIKGRDAVAALPDDGAVLYFHEAGFAMRGKGDDWHTCGLAFATIRPRGLRWPQITNGAGEVAKITPMKEAKRMALDRLDSVIAMIAENLSAFV
jgi:hypothetical protein